MLRTACVLIAIAFTARSVASQDKPLGPVRMNSAPTVCICLTFGAPQPRDPWFGADKVRHFVASFVVTSIAAGAARTAGADVEQSAWVGAGVGTSVGIWKELRDRGRPDATPSFRDLAWDLGGVGAAYASVRQVR